MHDKHDGTEEILEESRGKIGFVPNLFKEMARSPQVLELYWKGHGMLQGTALSEQEKQMVVLTVSRFNECSYCQTAHTFLASNLGVNAEEIAAIKQGRDPQEERARALVLATRMILTKRGWLTQENLQGLENRGVDRRQLYEIIAIIGLKTIANYINHIGGTEIDEGFLLPEEPPDQGAP